LRFLGQGRQPGSQFSESLVTATDVNGLHLLPKRWHGQQKECFFFLSSKTATAVAVALAVALAAKSFLSLETFVFSSERKESTAVLGKLVLTIRAVVAMRVSLVATFGNLMESSRPISIMFSYNNIDCTPHII
jgi:hypothetical protein